MNPDSEDLKRGIEVLKRQLQQRESSMQAPVRPLPSNIVPPSTQRTGADQFPVAEDIGLSMGYRRLEKRVTSLESVINVNTVPINTLGNDNWELKHPLNVGVEQRGKETFIACLYDADLYGYGDSIPEALDDLKTIIVGQFEYLLERQGQIKLGRALKQQLEYLTRLLVDKNA